MNGQKISIFREIVFSASQGMEAILRFRLFPMHARRTFDNLLLTFRDGSLLAPMKNYEITSMRLR